MNYKGYDDVQIAADVYRDSGRIALSIVDVEGPICRITTNLPDEELGDREIFVKNYSENDGMMDWLEENGIAFRTGREVISGYATIPVAKVAE